MPSAFSFAGPGRTAGRAATSVNKLPRREVMSPEEEESVLRKLGRGTLSAAAKVGNVLDIPGSMVRDVLTGNNPLDQLLSPTRADNRVGGRELLAQWGLATENDPNRWELADFTGFATEIALDPLTYASFGTSAFGKVGRAFKNAGLLDKSTMVSAARAAGKNVTGPRQARMVLTADDVLNYVPGSKATLEKSAKGMGFRDADDLLATQGQRPLGGLARVGLPFTEGAVVGTGETAQRVAGWMDKAGSALRWSGPGRMAHQAFGQRRETITKPGQQAAETAEKQFAANAPAGRDIASSLATDAHRHGLDDETLYEILEGQYGRTDTVLPAFNPARERALKERTREIYNEALQQWQAMEPLRKFQQANPKLMKHFAEGGDEAYIPKFHEYAYKFKDMGGWDVDEENVVDLFTTNPGKRMTLAEARQAAIQEAGLDEMKAPAFLDEAAEVPPLPDELARTVERYQDITRDQLEVGRKLGMKKDELLDFDANYTARRKVMTVDADGNLRTPVFSGADESSIAREGILRGRMDEDSPPLLVGGTATIMRLGKDEIINEMIDQGSSIDEITEAIQEMYGDRISDTYHEPGKGGSGSAGFEVRQGRHKELAKWLSGLPSAVRKAGIFESPTAAIRRAHEGTEDALASIEAVHRTLASDEALMWAAKHNKTGATVPLSEVYSKMGLDLGGVLEEADGLGELKQTPTGALAYHAELRGMTDPDDIKELGTLQIPANLAEDLLRIHKTFDGPEPTGTLKKAYDEVTNLFKTGVTSMFPAFHVRNRASGLIRNALLGMWSPQSDSIARQLTQGKVIPNIKDIPEIAERLALRGLDATDENATEMLRELVATHMPELLDNTAGQHTVRTGVLSPNAADLAKAMPGGAGGSNPFKWRNVAELAMFRGKEPGRFKPWATRGVGERTVSEFGPAAAGDMAGGHVEAMNRIGPFVEELRKGVDASHAAEKVRFAQVDYTGRSFSGFENQVLKRAFPFYSFTSRQVPYIIKTLMENPAGPTGQAIRAQRLAHDEDPRVPQYIPESASIGFGQSEDGTLNYLTGLGLMMDPGLQAIATPVQEGMGMLNPLPKAVFEYGTGSSFFRRAADGTGTPLGELDPPVGRTLSNISQMVTGQERDPVNWLGPATRPAEFLISNSPLSRFATTARTITDQRRPAWQTALNVGSGLRFSSVSPAQQRRSLLDRQAMAAKELGALEFSKTYFPDRGTRLTPAQEELQNIERLIRAGKLRQAQSTP